MRSEKGITLVALIGIMVLLVVLAGISISLVVTDGNSEQPINQPNDSAVTPVEDAEDEVVDTVDNTVVTNEVEE